MTAIYAELDAYWPDLTDIPEGRDVFAQHPIYGVPKTIGTLFSGFGGVDIGAQAAGLELAWGVEYDADIAAVAHANLPHDIRVANLLDCDPRTFEAVDVLHASPPCPNFSVAKAGGVETALDIALARKVAEFVTVLQPRIFTLENVWAYRGSQSWAIIQDALHGAGYWSHTEHVNAADMGVPQTRKRMIVRAIKGGFVPYLPEPVPWVGWYAAIEDLLPTLPESQFAPWQLARLPNPLRAAMVDSRNTSQEYGKLHRTGDEPMFTVTVNDRPSHMPRAFIAQVQGEGGDGVRYAAEPMQTVAANHGAGKYRAWLVSGLVAHSYLIGGDNTSNGITARADCEPSLTVTTGGPKHPVRGLLQSGRVVSMTPRALARFQSFPDSYELPSNARLAAKGIGNACPPIMMERIFRCLMEVTG